MATERRPEIAEQARVLGQPPAVSGRRARRGPAGRAPRRCAGRGRSRRRAGVGGALVPARRAGRDEDEVAAWTRSGCAAGGWCRSGRASTKRTATPDGSVVPRNVEGLARGDHRHREELGADLGEVLHQRRALIPQPTIVSRSRPPRAPTPTSPVDELGEGGDLTVLGDPAGQLLQRRRPGDGQAQHRRDGAVADDRVPLGAGTVPSWRRRCGRGGRAGGPAARRPCSFR